MKQRHGLVDDGSSQAAQGRAPNVVSLGEVVKVGGPAEPERAVTEAHRSLDAET